jgi:hypothetical protein
MKVFFGKELLSNAFLVGGAPVPFEQLAGNAGVIELDTDKDKALVDALNVAAAKGRGGIVKLSEEGYNAKKKLAPLSVSPRHSGRRDETLRILPRDLSPFRAAEAAEQPKLRDDGPTLEEWVAAGYQAAAYPPRGYAPRTASKPPTLVPEPTPAPAQANGAESASPSSDSAPAAAFKPATRRVKKDAPAEPTAPPGAT